MTADSNGSTGRPDFTDKVDYVFEFVDPAAPAPPLPVLVDRVDYVFEFEDPAWEPNDQARPGPEV